MGGKAIDLATPSAVLNDDGHMPKSYKKKDRRLPTKRFNPVSRKDDEDEVSEDEGTNGDLDGELDAQKFEEQPSELSLTINSVKKPKNEGIYDLAESTDRPPRVTSPNSNNNNGSDSSSSLVNLSDSLYDLVGKINAGDHSNNDQEFYEVIQQNSIEQDVYEPIIEPSSPMHVTTPARVTPPPPVSMSLPNSNVLANNKMTKTSSLGFLPSIPNEPSLDLYEPMADMEHQQVLYEEIPGIQGSIIDSGSDSEEECIQDSKPPIPATLPPPIPGPRRLTKGAEDEGDVYYDNAPILPLKVPSRSPSPIPSTCPIEQDDECYYGNAPSLKVPSRSPSPIPSTCSIEQDDESYYGNAPSLPQKPKSPNRMSSPDVSQRNIKSPIPTPRKISKQKDDPEDNEGHDEIYDDTIFLVNNESNVDVSFDQLNSDGDVTATEENQSGKTCVHVIFKCFDNYGNHFFVSFC